MVDVHAIDMPTSSQMAQRISILLVIITIWLTLIVYLSSTLPPSHKPLSFPHSIADVKELSETLKTYGEQKYWHVFSLYCTVFLFKQTIGIPGAALLNILGGILYGAWNLPLGGLLAGTGSTFAYLISKYLIGSILFGAVISRHRLMQWKVMIENNASGLLYFLISLRVLPLIPGWFLNLAAPFVGIPIDVFFLSTVIGLTPFHFICYQAASTMSSISSLSDVLNVWVLLKLMTIACFVLVPLALKSRFASSIEYQPVAKSPDRLV